MNRSFSLGLPLCILFGSFGSLVGAAGADLTPSSDRPLTLRAIGEPLKRLLPRLGDECNLKLSAGRSLEEQRLTLRLENQPMEQVARGMRDLLTPNDEASVNWQRGEAKWTLMENLNRRKLSERLRDEDLALYRRFIEDEIRWMRTDGQRELDAAPPASGNGMRSRNLVLTRFLLASILDSIGTEGRESLLHGEPLIVRFKEAKQPMREHLREYLTNRFVRLRGLPNEQMDEHAFVYLIARNPYNARGTLLFESTISPAGRVPARHSKLAMRGGWATLLQSERFSLKPADPDDPSRRVTLNLAPAPDDKSAPYVLRNLDQLLTTVGDAAGLNIIADGYLRPPQAITPNLLVKDYPLNQLLDRLAEVFVCEWRYQDAREKCVLMRARNWWMEDASNIPEPLCSDLRRKFAKGARPQLTDLLQFAELDNHQVHKLMETGECPGAAGVVQTMWYEEAGVRECLRFFSRLPKALKERAQSPNGLSVREAPPSLVSERLYSTLVAHVGSITPEAVSALTFSLNAVPGADGSVDAWEITFVRGDGSKWQRRIGPGAGKRNAGLIVPQ